MDNNSFLQDAPFKRPKVRSYQILFYPTDFFFISSEMYLQRNQENGKLLNLNNGLMLKKKVFYLHKTKTLPWLKRDTKTAVE